MNWDHVLNVAFRYNVAFVGALGAYELSKRYVARKRTSTKPNIFERVKLNTVCLFWLALFVGFVDVISNQGDQDNPPTPATATDLAVIFFVLLLPVIFGVIAGFQTTDMEDLKEPPTSSGPEW